ncbi:phage holin family protein [Streptomyces sp. SL13]|jgi:hypothetical protein|uniref:Phage holin family protein n=1 Tax=Streptantibioticus silvisoli TaxID=2705255 RepID=A0AA90H8U7_9ACTN|nr:phage holin family protein [Streptantibioticus silvisoli]MDI5965598.1 phage holin family protein [Streptantibioticus silvisoli]MDI5972619.1 phage holin family protein [Streptantibioticus silvisoli]
MVANSSVSHRPADTQSSVGVLVQQASAQMSELVRQEMRLARAEMAQKGKKAGLGGGMFGGAGLLSVIALQALGAAAIAALTLVLPLWASCLIVAGALLAVAGVMALVGRREFHRAVPPTPQGAIDGVRADVEEIKERAHR